MRRRPRRRCSRKRRWPLRPTTSLPAPQKDADIGAPALAGSATFQNGTYTIVGSGNDIWDQADQFHYVYQAVTGDIDVSARVASLQGSNGWAKAGVMIRETLAKDSRQALALSSTGQRHARSSAASIPAASR